MLKRLGVNIEQDASQAGFGKDYFPTDQAASFVGMLARISLHGGGAFSLQGAYGVGKSSLALFAMNQLSCVKKNLAQPSISRFPYSVKSDVRKVQKQGGMLPIPIVASNRSLATSIAVGLKNLAQEHYATNSKVLKSCLNLKPEQIDQNELIELLIRLATEIKGQEKVGILLIIDEFGRQLEHIIASKIMSDLHLLQNLAELTGIEHSPITLMIIQHHGLEKFSTIMLSNQRSEWDKVRGRFREVTIINTEIDTANIIAQLFQQHMPVNQGHKIRFAGRWPQHISLPLLRDKEYLSVANKCSPLHPMTTIMLSRLARILGQNDRTVVGWLTSGMNTGFADIVRRTTGQWLYPASLFDHFFGDMQMVPANPVLARRYAAIHSAYERLRGNASDNTIMVLQTIAMLNFCGGHGLMAKIDVIKACLPKAVNASKEIKKLEGQSLIVHRRHRQEYFVWEGSDYDLSGRVEETAARLELGLSNVLNQRECRKILAHAHLITTGNHRVAELKWLSADDIAPSTSSSCPRVLVWLEESPRKKGVNDTDVWGVAANIKGLSGQMREIVAICHLLEHDHALQNDLTALNEIRQRLAFHEEQALIIIDTILNAEIKWHVGGKKQSYSLQQAVSSAMMKAYPEALVLHNELINRDRVSGQVTGAIRMLIEAMYNNPDKRLLGIDKFPAERVIYDSLLVKKNIHHCDSDQQWRLTLDENVITTDLSRVVSVLTKTYSSGKPTEVTKAVEHLAAPPYGVKRIPSLLLCAMFVLFNRDKVELYEDGMYLPNWGAQTLVRMIRAPKSFALSLVTAATVSETTMKLYHKALHGQYRKNTVNSPVNLTRDLLIRYEGLSGYARKTLTVSKLAQGFRRAVQLARSPGDMLFNKIPHALGLASFPNKHEDVRQYCQAIKRIWKALESADEKLIKSFSVVTLKSTGCITLAQAREKIIKKANLLLQSKKIYHIHDQFLLTVLDLSDASDNIWFENMINKGLGIKTPTHSWNDHDASHAEFQLRRLLIGLQESANTLIISRKVSSDKVFAVFWSPNLDAKIEQEVEDELLPFFDNMPTEVRKQKMMSLIRHIDIMDDTS